MTLAPDTELQPAEAPPVDAHDRRRLAAVHPSDWRNPEPGARYHLVVVGAGTGGLVTAAIAAGLGARVALVERHLMGGDCLNVGCVPSKAVIRAARAWHAAETARAEFAGPRADGDGDFGAAMERMRRLRADLSRIDSAARFRELGVDVFLGQGRFTGPDALEVDGRRLRFRRAVIATGARAATPDIPGIDACGYLTNETVFSLTEPPDHLLVIGGGPIGCELAQAFARLGVRVTLLERGTRLLPNDDPDAARVVEHAMRRDGVIVRHGATVRRAERRAGRCVLEVEVDGRVEALAGDRVLVAVGRTPNTEGLGLDAAGVAHDATGVHVDDRLRTTARRIYAVGDICSSRGDGGPPLRFTHSADAQARLVVRNALFFGRGRASRLVVPWCTYTSPEVAHVGLTAHAASERGPAVRSLTVPLHDVDRAVLDGEEAGFLRVHLAGGSDRILGATLVGAHAGETIGELTLAMASGLGLSAIGDTVHPYPTQAEALRKAADAWRRGRLTPLARRVFGTYFRLVR